MDASPQTFPPSVPLVLQLLSTLLILLILLAPGKGEAIVAVEVPGNVHSLSGEGCIHILWDGTSAQTYRVYRRTATTSYSPTVFFTSSEPTFADRQVEKGVTYYYAVTAVYSSGMESPHSVETAETYTDTFLNSYSDLVRRKPALFTSPPAAAAVGDLDHDGKADLVLGIPDSDKVKIYRDAGVQTLPDLTLTVKTSGERFGSSLALVDLDRDGYDDLVVGAPHADAGKKPRVVADAGKVYVYRGGAQFGSEPVLTISGKASYNSDGGTFPTAELLGTSIAHVGDINGDGFQDVAIGAPAGGLDRSGRVVVLLGGQNIEDRNVEIMGPDAMKYMGRSLGSAGDVNGDGIVDMVVGSTDCENPSLPTGEARLVLGGSSLHISPAVFSGPNCYGSIVGGLDFNGDGFSDVVVGSEKASSTTHIYYGGPNMAEAPSVSFPLTRGAIAPLGDVDGDGFDDLALGHFIVHYGNADGESVPDILRAEEGRALLGTGDINGDGTPEAIVYHSGKVHTYAIKPYLSLPRLKLASPPDYISTMSSRIEVAGSAVGSIAALWVKGEEAQISADGRYSTSLALREGNNVVEVVAETPDGNISKRTVNVIHVPPPPLHVTITAPEAYSHIHSNPVVVMGTVSDSSASVRVNGIPATVSGNNFLAGIILSPASGYQDIWVSAEDSYLQTALAHTSVRFTYPPPTVNLSVTPASIRPGETSLLSWTSSDASSCTIDPGIGEVAATGSIPVTPLSTVTYTLTGVGQGGTSSTTATVNVVNTPPVAEADNAMTEEDCPAVVRVLTNDSDADGQALTVVHATQGNHGSVSINPDGVLIYTPSANFNGSDTFSYTVSDLCGATATAAVNIVVTPVNDPPFAVDDATETESGVPIVIPVLTNDKDSDGDTPRMSRYTQPAHGTVAEEGNGFLKYSPLSNFEGTDMFTYTIEDGSGLECTAAVAVKVTGPMLLEITSPLNGGLVKDSTVLVQGTVLHRRGLQTGVTVNGIPAVVYAGQFIANEVPIQEGENTIVACAKDVDGNSVKVSVNIDAETEADCVRIRSIAYWGVAPIETMLTIGSTLQAPSITDTGPGTVEYLPKNNDDEYPIRITSEGIYRFTAEAPDAQGEMCSNELAIVVFGRQELDTLLQAKWHGMKSKLGIGAVEEALGYFREKSRDNYRNIFNALVNELPQIVSGMQDIEMVAAQGNRAEYRISRVHNIDGAPVTVTYTIYFVLDEDGIWRLDRF